MKRRNLKLRSGWIDTAKARYPIERSWDGTYRQRFVIHNSENQTDAVADLSAVEMTYWIETLQKGLNEMRTRMERDLSVESE